MVHTIQVPRSSAVWFYSRFLKVFTIYGHGENQDHLNKLSFHHPKESAYELDLCHLSYINLPSVSEMFKNNDERMTESLVYYKLTHETLAQVS